MLTPYQLQTVKCEEDDEFIKELEKTMAADVSNRMSGSTKLSSTDLAIPMNQAFKGFFVNHL